MDASTYRTVAGDGEAVLLVRDSRFHARIKPVDSEASAEAFIDDVRTNVPEATHHVPSYRVRVGSGDRPSGYRVREYQSDAGEPNGSAGPPVLNVLQGQDLENVAVVVTRHYGGTNLGIGGLASAYSDAVAGAIDDAGTRIAHVTASIAITVAYDDSGTVRTILERSDVEFSAAYKETVTFTVDIPVPLVEDLLDDVRSATSGRATIDTSAGSSV